jgi:hypothetical protein
MRSTHAPISPIGRGTWLRPRVLGVRIPLGVRSGHCRSPRGDRNQAPPSGIPAWWPPQVHADVAQWLERPPVERMVEGSIPFVGARLQSKSAGARVVARGRSAGAVPGSCARLGANHGGFAVGKASGLLTRRGASRRRFDSCTLRTSRRSLLGRSASLITTRQVVRLHPTGLCPCSSADGAPGYEPGGRAFKSRQGFATGCSAAWSARRIRDAEVAGSSPASPTCGQGEADR